MQELKTAIPLIVTIFSIIPPDVATAGYHFDDDALPLSLAVFPASKNTRVAIHSYYRGQILDLILTPRPLKSLSAGLPGAKGKIAAIESLPSKSSITYRITLTKPGLNFRVRRSHNPELVVIELAPDLIMGDKQNVSLFPMPIVRPMIPRPDLKQTSASIIRDLVAISNEQTTQNGSHRHATLEKIRGTIIPCAADPTSLCRKDSIQVLTHALSSFSGRTERAELALLLARFFQEESLDSEAIAHLEMALEGQRRSKPLPPLLRNRLELARAILYLRQDPEKGLLLLKKINKQTKFVKIRLAANLTVAYHLLVKGELSAAYKMFSSILKSRPQNPSAAFGMAETMLISQKPGKALKLYKELADNYRLFTSPVLSLLTLRIGDAYFFLNNMEQARIFYKKAAAFEDQDTASLARLRLQVLKVIKDGPDAMSIAEFKEMSGTSPGPYTRAAAILALARCHNATGELHEAWNDYLDLQADPIGRTLSKRLENERNKLIKEIYEHRMKQGNPLSVCARYIRDHMSFPLVADQGLLEKLESMVARSFVALGFYDDAVEIIQKSLQRPGNIRTRLERLAHLGKAYFTAGDFYRAKATSAYMVSRMGKIDNLPIDGVLLESGIRYREKRYAGTIHLLDKTLARKLKNEEVLSRLNLLKARALRAMGRSDEAVIAYLKADELYKNLPYESVPDDIASLRFELAQELLKLKKYGEAAKWFLKAEKSSNGENSREAMNLLAAHCLLNAGKTKQAKTILAGLKKDSIISNLAASYAELVNAK